MSTAAPVDAPGRDGAVVAAELYVADASEVVHAGIIYCLELLPKVATQSKSGPCAARATRAVLCQRREERIEGADLQAKKTSSCGSRSWGGSAAWGVREPAGVAERDLSSRSGAVHPARSARSLAWQSSPADASRRRWSRSLELGVRRRQVGPDERLRRGGTTVAGRPPREPANGAGPSTRSSCLPLSTKDTSADLHRRRAHVGADRPTQTASCRKACSHGTR
jgi:hypothetical protein